MVEGITALQTYGEIVEELNRMGREEPLDRRGVELFFSFDIVNSSAYKTLNFTGWSKVIITLFNKIQQLVAKKMPGAEMWRILGDEVIFVAPIREKQDFYVYTDCIFEMLNHLVSQLKTGEFFDSLDGDESEKALTKMQSIISLKSAAWIAIVGEGLVKLERFDNLLERYKLQDGYGIFEFLGNDIDAGFRIKQETQDRRFTISYELAYILSKDTDCLRNIHIITYKRLKGIWQERLYPIIWYHDPKYVNGMAFEESFYYDEKENSGLVREYFENREAPVLQEEMYTDVHKALAKIMEDQKLKEKFKRIDKIIQESQKDVYHLLEPKFLLKLHCVAVCCNMESKEILIMKRAAGREIYPDRWEFGCAKGSLEQTLAAQIEKEYLEDFGIKIEVICNEKREDRQPLPLAMYEVKSDQGKDKGVITLARITEPYRVENFRGPKHSEVRWIREEEVEAFDEPAIPDFKNTLAMAFKKMREVV